MAGRLLEYTAMHHRRHEKPVYPVVINLTGRGRQAEQYIMDCLELTVVDFSYRMINLEDITGRDFLYRGPVGLLPLVPLMRQDDPPEEVLEKCASRLESEVTAQDERATLYVALAALSSLRFSKELILKVLEVSKLENLPLFDGIREQWEAKGEARGEAKGEARGEVKGRLDTLFDVLEAKFGKVPDDLRSQLSELKDPVIIKDTIRKVINTETIDEFSRSLKN
jgi:predicted transposase YdaD